MPSISSQQSLSTVVPNSAACTHRYTSFTSSRSVSGRSLSFCTETTWFAATTGSWWVLHAWGRDHPFSLERRAWLMLSRPELRSLPLAMLVDASNCCSLRFPAPSVRRDRTWVHGRRWRFSGSSCWWRLWWWWAPWERVSTSSSASWCANIKTDPGSSTYARVAARRNLSVCLWATPRLLL